MKPTRGLKALVAQVNEVPQSGRHPVELAVAVGDEQHRQEAGQEDGRHLQPDLRHGRPEGRRQA
jgi:hypothetical protein